MGELPTMSKSTGYKNSSYTVGSVVPEWRAWAERHKSVLYDSGERVTDATDQELFFESGVSEKLKAHNEYRERTLNKAATKKADKEVHLEPIRIRDLRMSVIEIEAF